ncbi:MAG: hypothetical protein AAF915_01905 [Cyanobacteria bacterium P01_D01_bin.50]
MKLELNKSENWVQIFNKTIVATKVTSTRYAPIPNIKPEINIEQRILAIQITCSNAKDTWNWAGYLSQLNTSISNALGTTSQVIEKRKLWLNQVNLLMFPEHTLDYRVSLNVPTWFEDVSLKIWKYIASASNVTDNLLLEIRQQELQRIESKIDDLNAYGR